MEHGGADRLYPIALFKTTLDFVYNHDAGKFRNARNCLLWSPLTVKFLSAFCLASMVLTYLPTLKFYRMSAWWAFAMPLIGSLYLAMTWTSAINHWLGQTSQWKGRIYDSKGS